MLQEKTSHFPDGLHLNPKKIKLKKPRGASINVDLNITNLGSPRYLFYYAAQPKKTTSLKYIEPDKAYDKLQNSGLVKVGKDGHVILHLRCPQNYIEKGLWYPHVHFLISNKNNTKWMPNLYTRLVLCPVDKTFMKHAIQTDSYMILNALPMSEYIKEHIPNSFPLPYDILGKLKDSQIISYVKEMSIHHKSISNYISKKKDNIYHVPIVVYCYNKQCNASYKVIQRLWKIGFKNIKEYEGGVVDWRK
jgi:rhodanese-related sulfurtransferase